MATVPGIFLGATGLFDGTLCDAENPVFLPNDRSPVRVDYRLYDDVTGGDPAEDSADFANFDVRDGDGSVSGVIACDTIDGEYEPLGAFVLFEQKWVGANKPLFLKSAPYGIGVSGGAYVIRAVGDDTVAGTRLPAPASLTLTPSATSILAEWTAPASGTPLGYQVRIDGGSWVDKGTALSHTFEGLTTGVEYMVEVRAYDASGVGAVASESATPVVFSYAQDFSSVTDGDTVLGVDGWTRNESLVNNSLSTFKAATVASQKLVLFENNHPVTPAGTYRAAMYRDFEGLSLEPDTEVEFKFRLVDVEVFLALVDSSSPSFLGTDQFLTLRMADTGALSTFNGSAYVDVFTGLSVDTTYTLRVRFKQGDTTAQFSLDGGSFVEGATRKAVPGTLGIMQPSVSSASTTKRSGYFGDISITRV